MILAFDTYYYDEKARTICLAFESWEAADYVAVYSEELENIADYTPGEFYKRELPCILSLLKKIGAEQRSKQLSWTGSFTLMMRENLDSAHVCMKHWIRVFRLLALPRPILRPSSGLNGKFFAEKASARCTQPLSEQTWKKLQKMSGICPEHSAYRIC